MDGCAHDVYQGEMKSFGKLSEQELDRLFSGKAPAENSGLDDISALARKVQSAFTGGIDPAVESTHLAALMQRVNLTEKGDLAAMPASKVTGPGLQASGLPKLRRRFMLESLFATLAAKIAAGGLAVVMAAVPVAATGNFPDQMQTGISQAVEKVGIHIPAGESDEADEAADDSQNALDEAAEEATDAVSDGDGAAGDAEGAADGDTEGNEGNEPNENAGFGQSVAADARDGGVDGQQVSEAARAQAEERKAAGQAHRPENAGRPTTSPTSPAPANTVSPGQKGLDKAADTPAASHIPANVPGGRPAGAGRP